MADIDSFATSQDASQQEDSAQAFMEFERILDRYSKVYMDLIDRVAETFGGVGVDAFVLGCEINLRSGYFKGPYCTQRDLVEAWIYPKQTIHSSVERMIKRGLLTLEPIPGNRKEKAIVLTDMGRQIAEEHIAPCVAALMRVKKSFPLEEQKAFVSLLSRYIQVLEQETRDLYPT